MDIAVTNNPMVRDRFTGYEISFHDTDFLGVLKIVRDKIHLGHKLLSHPLSGSVKPGETPYKIVLITSAKGLLDDKALLLIEESIQSCSKFAVKAFNPEMDSKVLADFQLIDYDLVLSDK